MSTLKTNRIENLTTTDGGISINNSGNVGVNTTNPHQALDIGGTTTSLIKFTPSNYGTGATDGAHIGVNFGGLEIWQYENNYLRFGTNNQERLKIDSAGRLLLGTTTEGQPNADDLTVASSGHTGVTIRSGTSNNGSVFFSDGTSGNDEFRGYVQYNHSDNRLVFGTNAAEVMRIDSSGNAGIGVTSLNSSSRLTLLESAGNAQTLEIKGANSGGAGSQPGIRLTASSGDNIGGIYGDTNSDAVILQSGGTERLRVESDGRIKATTSGLYVQTSNSGSGNSDGLALHCDGNTDAYLWNYENTSLRFGTNNTEKARITNAGLMGIGVSSPTNTLHVVDANGSSGSADFGSTANRARIYADSNGIRFGSVSNHPVILRTNGTERMRISSGGGVSIGTTSSAQGITPASVLRLGNNNLGTYAFTNISTTVTNISPGSGIGGLAFVQAYNTANGAQYIGLLMWRYGHVVAISENNNTGLTLNFTTSGSTLRLATSSGTVSGLVFTLSAST